MLSIYRRATALLAAVLLLLVTFCFVLNGGKVTHLVGPPTEQKETLLLSFRRTNIAPTGAPASGTGSEQPKKGTPPRLFTDRPDHASSTRSFTLHRLPSQSSTNCLDGSPGSYFFREGPPSSIDWMIGFEGGGWCLDEASCAARSRTYLGSSTTAEGHFMYLDERESGLISTNCTTNPDFCHLNVLVIHHCQGLRGPAPMLASANAAMRDARQKFLHRIDHRKSRVILVGASAGAVAVLLSHRAIVESIRTQLLAIPPPSSLRSLSVDSNPPIPLMLISPSALAVFEVEKELASRRATNRSVEADALMRGGEEEAATWFTRCRDLSADGAQPFFVVDSTFDAFAANQPEFIAASNDRNTTTEAAGGGVPLCPLPVVSTPLGARESTTTTTTTAQGQHFPKCDEPGTLMRLQRLEQRLGNIFKQCYRAVVSQTQRRRTVPVGFFLSANLEHGSPLIDVAWLGSRRRMAGGPLNDNNNNTKTTLWTMRDAVGSWWRRSSVSSSSYSNSGTTTSTPQAAGTRWLLPDQERDLLAIRADSEGRK